MRSRASAQELRAIHMYLLGAGIDDRRNRAERRLFAHATSLAPDPSSSAWMKTCCIFIHDHETLERPLMPLPERAERRFSRRSRTARGARRWRRMERSVSGGGAGRYLPVRSRCLHPGQQQGRRWPSSSSSQVRRMRRSRVNSCLASSTQQMNSFRARGVMSFQASSAVGLAISALRRSAGRLCTTPPGTRWLLTGPR